jgi:hypothetical protein
MSLTYEWTLLSYKKVPFPPYQDVVIHADWKVKGTDENGDSAEYKSTVIWDPNHLNGNGFIPHDLLDNEQILNWVKDLVSTQPERNIDEKIRNSILASKGT